MYESLRFIGRPKEVSLTKSYTKTGLDEYSAAADHLTAMVSTLKSWHGAKKEHGQVEEFLHKEGCEVLRLLLQGFLDGVSKHEVVREVVIDAKKTELTHKRAKCNKNIESVFGRVCLKRLGYSLPGSSQLCPLDAQLNLPDETYSDGMRKHVALEVVKGSYEQSIKSVCRTSGGQISKFQAQELTARAAKDFERFYKQSSVPVAEPSSLLILTLDGKGIVMRQESLTESTRKLAERKDNKMKTRLSKGEKGNRKRMATVAAVYSVEPHYRSAEQIMNLTTEEAESPRPKPSGKRAWASVERPALEVAREVFLEAQRRDPEHKRPWVIVVDGQEQQLANIRKCIREFGLVGHATLVLDFIHVLEYLWKAAFCFNAEGSDAAEKWVAQRALLILQGKASNVAGGIRRSATLKKLSGKLREAADKSADYLLKYAHMLKYDKYLKRGFPIASGVIEGACRYLIKDRLDITGARWGLAGAEAVLKLRSIVSSGDFDNYWLFHKQQELKRNHSVHYMDFSAVMAA
jgi:hypothetical protein